MCEDFFKKGKKRKGEEEEGGKTADQNMHGAVSRCPQKSWWWWLARAEIRMGNFMGYKSCAQITFQPVAPWLTLSSLLWKKGRKKKPFFFSTHTEITVLESHQPLFSPLEATTLPEKTQHFFSSFPFIFQRLAPSVEGRFGWLWAVRRVWLKNSMPTVLYKPLTWS